MEQSADINILTKTILIGLPAVGKSTLTDEICQLVQEETGIALESVSSDLKLREVRKDENNPVVQKFMREHNIPESDFPILIKTNDFMKKYGEPAFRDLESDVILDMLQNGEFEGKIPNLGGKAMLHPKTAAAFKKRGYSVVYLKANVEDISKHITKDFEAMLEGATITRSNINGPILDALKNKYPKYAEVSPEKFTHDVIQKTRKILKKANASRMLRKMRLTKIKEAYRYSQRMKLRDEKAMEIMSKMNKERDELYAKTADIVLLCSENKQENLKNLITAIKNRQTQTALNSRMISARGQKE